MYPDKAASIERGNRMTNATVICATGMGRGGTSSVARMLNLLGVDLGPADHLMGPGEFNAEVFGNTTPLSI